jgi:menaquinone-9 beta-reductase
MRRAPPVIVGGGPAGAAAAIVLARAGHCATLIERTTRATDKVCGDFLSVEAIDALLEFGIDLDALAPAPITAIRVIHGRRVATTRLPFAAYGLTRRALDEALLRRAASLGADLRRGHTARRIITTGPRLLLDCGSGPNDIAADTVFLATGKHELRGASRQFRSSGLVGLKMYYALHPEQGAALRHHIELVLFPGGYAGLQHVEGERAVLCALIPAHQLREGAGNNPLELLADACPHLGDRLTGARPLLERPIAVAGLPYGYVHTVRHDDPPGLFRLGDQGAVIGSLTGDGVALALSSAVLAAHTWLSGRDAAAYHGSRASGLFRQMRLARFIHGLCLNHQIQRMVVEACHAWPAAIRLAANWTRTGTITQTSV